MRKSTKEKYYDFMMELYTAKEFDIKYMQSKYRIGSRVVTLMREAKMIKREGDVTKWIGNAPTQAIVNSMVKECLKQSRIDQAQSKAGMQQMTIAPVRKAPASTPTPTPIVHEAECDNSNSKMLLIMAIGAVIGFMIATAIWK
jgi:hypothetical protein